MHLVYLDDSGEDEFQMVGAVIVPEWQFLMIEEYLASTIDEIVPEELRDTFEFHASALFNSRDAFSKISRDRALEIFERCISIVQGAPLVIVYGAVNAHKLRGGIYATARPTDVAFRTCLTGLAEWFQRYSVRTSIPIDQWQIGMFILDDTKDQRLKTDLQKAFRSHRRQLKSATHERGPLEYVHDDMYFGDSSFSVGIQLADMCSYIILRHLNGKEDTEYLYERLEPHLFFGMVEPDGKPHGNPNASTSAEAVTMNADGEIIPQVAPPQSGQ